jgi:predicted nucleic acid-binding protein
MCLWPSPGTQTPLAITFRHGANALRLTRWRWNKLAPASKKCSNLPGCQKTICCEISSDGEPPGKSERTQRAGSGRQHFILPAVFGRRVRQISQRYESHVIFCTPDTCFYEARLYIPQIARQRAIDSDLGISALNGIELIVETVTHSLYEEFESDARDRMKMRDPNDWSAVATALLLNFPVWTQDQDFFGSGVATWTTDRVELHLRESWLRDEGNQFSERWERRWRER